MPLGQQDEVVEELEGLGRRLQEGDDHGAAVVVDGLAQALDDLEGGGAVQSRGDLVHEEGLGWAYGHLACTNNNVQQDAIDSALVSCSVRYSGTTGW